MSAKKFLLPAVGATVLAAGGAAAYLYLKGPATDGNTPLTLATVIPDEAYMTAFVSSDQQAWSKLQQFGTPEAQTVISQSLQNLQKDISAQSNIDFEKDIKPWIGHSMVALLPKAQSKAAQPSLLAVITIRDKISALQFAGKLASQSGGQSKESEYKGNKVISSQDGKVYAALLKDYLVLATDQTTLENAINTTQGEPSLASKPEAKAVLSQALEIKNTLAKAYLLDYGKSLESLLASNPQAESLSSLNTAQLKQVKSMVAGLGVDDEGMRFKAVVAMDPSAPKYNYKAVSGKVISQFPADTMALFSGGNISQVWSQATQQSQSDPTTQKTLDEMREAAKTANLDLDKDVFSWMDGEFGLALIPSDRGILAQLGFGGLMVIDTSDRQTAEATLAKLDTLAKSSSIAVAQRDVQGKKVTEWNSPFGSILGHGWLDNDSVFVALGGPMIDIATTPPSTTLDSSNTFKTTTNGLPKQNLGYFYLDMDKTMAQVNRFSMMTGAPIPPEPAAVLNSIQGIGMTSTKVDEATGAMDLLLALKKAK